MGTGSVFCSDPNNINGFTQSDKVNIILFSQEITFLFVYMNYIYTILYCIVLCLHVFCIHCR